MVLEMNSISHLPSSLFSRRDCHRRVRQWKSTVLHCAVVFFQCFMSNTEVHKNFLVEPEAICYKKNTVFVTVVILYRWLLPLTISVILQSSHCKNY